MEALFELFAVELDWCDHSRTPLMVNGLCQNSRSDSQVESSSE